MIGQKDIFNKLIEKATATWSDIESERKKKVGILDFVKARLADIATPAEENNVKIEIVRQTCKRLKELYPGYTGEIDEIVKPFEHHLKFDHIAVLPFKEIDSLTFRIYMNQNMLSFCG